MVLLVLLLLSIWQQSTFLYRNRNNNKNPSGPMLRDLEESIFYLIDLAKCFNLDLKKILNHTTKSGYTLFFLASICSERITRRLLEENVQVNSVNQDFVTPFFRVSMIFISKMGFLTVTQFSE